MRPPEELLYDSEASLRLVDHAIEELNDTGTGLDDESRAFLEHVMEQPGGFSELSRTLLRAYAETAGIVHRIRDSCGMTGTDDNDSLQQMYGRLREISSVTETATTGLLDSLTRAIGRVEALESASESERRRLIASLRDDLGHATQQLQFQDIAAQQLGYLSNLVVDMRARISHIVALMPAPMVSFLKTDAARFDPNASLGAAPANQAVADEIFAVRGTRKSA